MLAYVADVPDSRAAEDMVATAVKQFARLDVLINNVGVHVGGDPAEVTNDRWRKVMATDVDGVFYGCRAALPHLEKTKGSIVNTASVSGLDGDWGMSPYNAAKGAVVNLTRALAMDMGKKGVRINAVCPDPHRNDGRQASASQVRRTDSDGTGLRASGNRIRDCIPGER